MKVRARIGIRSKNEESDDDDQEEEEFDQENESEDDEIKSDEEQGMDDTTDQFDDDADARLEEPTETARIVQGEGNDTEMTEAQQGNENLETTQEQLLKNAHWPRKDMELKMKDPSAWIRPWVKEEKRQAKCEPTTDKSVQSKEPVFEVVDSNMPQDQAGNLGDNKDEPRDETASRSDWFKKPIPPKEPTDPDWNVSKTTKKGPTQTWLMNLAASNPTEKSLKDFDELMSTPIDFYSFVLNGLKIENLTQQILLGPAFRLLKGT
ncbi:hypothetical protein Tco_1458178 [Tanacetum coccineum]